MKRFACDNVEAGEWPADDAERMAREKFAHFLPGGIETKGHRFFELRDDDEQIVGWIWVANEEPGAFVYDIEVEEPFRGRGHARRGLEWLHRMLASEGVVRVELHVFPNANEARSLYESLGYVGTGAFLSKTLA